MKIALVSFEPELKNTGRNFKKASELINAAKHKGANLCIFPESTMSGFIFPITFIQSIIQTLHL